jgi:VIT1/CCC1 family predicted Fe2+/Mn2+ transporter
MAAFTIGALLPLLTIILFPAGARVGVTVVAVVLALAGTGWASARLGASPARKAVLRNVAGGLVAMVVTYLIGSLVGTQIG